MIHDLSYLGTKLEGNAEYVTFAEQEAEKETWLGCFSRSFPMLLPGMACMPTYIIACKEKLWVITDHSAGPLSLNSLISKDNRAVPLCSLQQLGYHLRRVHAQYPD